MEREVFNQLCYYNPEQYLFLGCSLGFVLGIYVVEGLGLRFFRRGQIKNRIMGDSSEDEELSSENDEGYNSEQQDIVEAECSNVPRELHQEVKKSDVKLFTSSFGTRYASQESLRQRNQEYRDKIILSRRYELDIINQYRVYEGSSYHLVRDKLKFNESGYIIHPVYINDDAKTVYPEYSNKVIGVRVYDPMYEDTGEFSRLAIVTDIIDVGGQDKYNRGLVLSTSTQNNQ